MNEQLTLDQAYQATYLWLDHAGDPPINISEPAHGSVELITAKAFVRVRSSDTPVEQSSVLALLRAADTGKKLVIFSPSGFSPGARAIAQTQGIALFSLDASGRAAAETTHARSMSPATEPDPPFAPPENAEDGDWWAGMAEKAASQQEEEAEVTPELQAATTDWADCRQCGATHFHNARFCRDCGTNLQAATGATDSTGQASPKPERVTTGSRLRCRNCGSHDIEMTD